MPNIDEHLTPLRPCAEALLRWLAPHVDDEMLREIAETDAGFHASENFDVLARIRRDARVERPFEFWPREVLELTKWSEPEDPKWCPDGRVRRGHLMRAFSCAALLVAEVHDYGRSGSEVETLIQLVRSCAVIDDAALRELSRLLAWRMLDRSFANVGDERPFFGTAMLLGQLQFAAPTMSAAGIVALADWVAAEEERWRGHGPKPERWLLGLTFHDQRHAAWLDTARQCLSPPRSDLGGEVAARLADLGRRLVDG